MKLRSTSISKFTYFLDKVITERMVKYWKTENVVKYLGALCGAEILYSVQLLLRDVWCELPLDGLSVLLALGKPLPPPGGLCLHLLQYLPSIAVCEEVLILEHELLIAQVFQMLVKLFDVKVSLVEAFTGSPVFLCHHVVLKTLTDQFVGFLRTLLPCAVI